MKRLVLAAGALAAALGVGLLLNGSATADHQVAIQLRPLHSKACVTAVETALKGKAGKIDVNKDAGVVTVTVPHTGPVSVTDLISALRGKGYEPMAVTMRVGLDTKLTLKSGGFGIKESQQELKDALGELGFLDVNSAQFAGSTLTVAVSNGEIDLVKLVNAAQKAGFNLSGLDVTGSPGSTTVTAKEGSGLKQPQRDTCLVLAKAARLFTKYKGVDVPFCCKNCQAKFEGLSDAEKDVAVKDAVERLGEDRSGKKKEAPAAGGKLPTQAQIGNKCVILGDPGKFFAEFKGLKVPLCCNSCRDEWSKMSDADKTATLAKLAK
jgi:copper chaperone CopZ